MVQDIVFSHSDADDLTQLLADSLHCEPECAGPLAQLIHAKTTGNPFLRFSSFPRSPMRPCSASTTVSAAGYGT